MSRKLNVIPMSIAEFYTGTGNTKHPSKNIPKEEIILLHSEGFEHGPGIERDGMGEPWMWMGERNKPTKQVTHPIEQRRGTWLIDPDKAKEIEINLIKGDKSIDQQTKDRWIKELDETPNYFDVFEDRYPDYDILGMQGCGNLSMNNWFVGYLKSKFTSEEPRFFYVSEDLEKFPERVYSCLVKWKNGSSPRISIEDIKFNFHARCVQLADNDSDKTNQIEFAVFGQKLVDNFQLVDFKNIAIQFADIRHLYKLPNINPSTEFGSEIIQPKRPRMLFGKFRNYDVWFGEAEMIQEGNEDLLRHALSEPVLLDIQHNTMGLDWTLSEATFGQTGYRTDEMVERFGPRARGEWRKYSDHVVEIFLQRNVYSYTMLGIDSDNNIIASAAGGLAGRIGQTLEAMAQNMISSNSRKVLLIDEGNDVFQWIDGQYTVMPRRGRIRAALVFARKKEESKPEQKKRSRQATKPKRTGNSR